jgi:hypothetical protein
MTYRKSSRFAPISLIVALGMALFLIPSAEAAAITATSLGSVSPQLVAYPGFVVNGDFLIFGSAEAPVAGDGIDDYTVWHFQFHTDPGYSTFDFSVPLSSAWMTVTLTAKDPAVSNDQFWIEEMHDHPIQTAELESLPPGVTATLQFQLLDFYTSGEVIGSLLANNGELPMRYHDDALISYASLTLTNGAAAVPEPSSWALASLGVVLLVTRRIAAG